MDALMQYCRVQASVGSVRCTARPDFPILINKMSLTLTYDEYKSKRYEITTRISDLRQQERALRARMGMPDVPVSTGHLWPARDSSPYPCLDDPRVRRAEEIDRLLRVLDVVWTEVARLRRAWCDRLSASRFVRRAEKDIAE